MQTPTTDGAPITVAGTIVSLSPSGRALIINGVTTTLSAPFQAISFPAPVITIDNQPISANSALEFVVQRQTLIVGESSIIVAGTTPIF